MYHMKKDGRMLSDIAYRLRWKKAAVLLSVVVVVATVGALMMPATTMNRYICGLEEHTHTADCIGDGAVPVFCCDAETAVHVHSDACYNGEALICGIADVLIHTHDAFCFGSGGKLVCSLAEYPPRAETAPTPETAVPPTAETEPSPTTEDAEASAPETEVPPPAETEISPTTEDAAASAPETEAPPPAETETSPTTEDAAVSEPETEAPPTAETEPSPTTEDAEASVPETEVPPPAETEISPTTEDTAASAPETEAPPPAETETSPTTEDAGAAESETESDASASIAAPNTLALHTHADACYAEGIRVCGMTELRAHQHTAACLTQEDAAFCCGFAAHVHSDTCRADLSADVETAEIWEATLPAPEGEDWTADLLAAARSQLGYRESARNAILGDDARPRGYTRYGAWAADYPLDGRELEYHDWQALFVSFCLHYAGIPSDAIVYGTDPSAWMTSLADTGARVIDLETKETHIVPILTEAGDGTPDVGDIVFLDRDADGAADGVGILDADVCAEGMYLLAGDVDNAVATAAWEPETLLCYLDIDRIAVQYRMYLMETMAAEGAQTAPMMLALDNAETKTRYAYVGVISNTHTPADRLIADAPSFMDYQDMFDHRGDTISTEFAGGVWMDKTVITDTIQYGYEDADGNKTSTNEITSTDDTFLVALSSIAATRSVTGWRSKPTDTMFILDLSSSMYNYDGHSAYPVRVVQMVQAVNESIARLSQLNPLNRVGVTIYYGGNYPSPQAQSTHSKVLLELGRYESTDNAFLAAIGFTGTAQAHLNNEAYQTYLHDKPNYNPNQYKLYGIGVSPSVTKNNASVAENTHVVIEWRNATTDSPAGFYGKTAGTFAQLGLLNAGTEFTRSDINRTYEAGKYYQPIFVFMTDGKPTAATENYTGMTSYDFDAHHTGTISKETDAHLFEALDACMGSNREGIRNAAETDFLTQLTAAYVKEIAKKSYGNTVPLFYTLGLGSESTGRSALSEDILNPMGADTEDYNNTDHKNNSEAYGGGEKDKITENIRSYWSALVSNGKLTLTTRNWYSSATWDGTRPVTHSVEKQQNFPTNISQQDYVDSYFVAENAGGLKDAFNAIVEEISLKEQYEATLIDPGSNVDIDGGISFIDIIGEYMSVRRMRGILINGQLHTGANIAQNFTDGGAFGTVENPTDAGNRFVATVAEQIGLEPVSAGHYDHANAFILNAFQTGQIAYQSDGSFSNYIGWYGHVASDGMFENCGFYHEPDVACPESNPDGSCPHTAEAAVLRGATHAIRSYFYFGTVHPDGTDNTAEMMNVTVWIRERIATDSSGKEQIGQESVVYHLPASLLPTVEYYVALGLDKTAYKVTASGADVPAMLLYEVGLDEDLDVTALMRDDSPEEITYAEERLAAAQAALATATTEAARLAYQEDIAYFTQYLAEREAAAEFRAYVEKNAEENDAGEITAIRFYSNEWNRAAAGVSGNDTHLAMELTGRGQDNTYGYFRPSTSNDRYYYTQIYGADTFTDEKKQHWVYRESGASGDIKIDGTYYSRVPAGDTTFDKNNPGAYYDILYYHTVAADGTITEVKKPRAIYAEVLTYATDSGEAYYYIPIGTPVTLSGTDAITRFTFAKVGDGVDGIANPTGTLPWSDVPFVQSGATPNDFIVSASQGNNGILKVYPVTFSGTKTVEGLPAYRFDDAECTFELYAVSDANFDMTTAKRVMIGRVAASPTKTQQMTDINGNPIVDDANQPIMETVVDTANNGAIVFDTLWADTAAEDSYYVIRERRNPTFISDETQYLIQVKVENKQPAEIVTTVIGTREGDNGEFEELGSQQIQPDEIDFTNRIGAELPETGGPGLERAGYAMFTGGCLTAFALWALRRKARQSQSSK